MRQPSAPVKLSWHGPADSGLASLDLDPADFQSDLPRQSWHLAHEDEGAGRYIGVWTTTPMQEAFGPYPGDEFMVILEGHVRMLDADGRETRIEAGQAFCVHNATPVSWKQDNDCRKFFMISADPDAAPVGAPPSGVTVFDAGDIADAGTADIPAFCPQGDGLAVRHGLMFENAAKTMRAALLSASPGAADTAGLSGHALLHVAEGALTLESPGGEAVHLKAGEAAYLPDGSAPQWRVEAPIVAYYAHSNAGGF